jgi:putative ABC transport system permease protein
MVSKRIRRMMQPRWRKIWADFWGNKTRTILVIMSIAVGVFAVGFVSSSYAILQKDMDSEFKKANSSEATIYCAPFKEELLNTLRQVPGVLMVEGRSSITVRTQVEPGKKAVMYILSIPPVSNEQWSKMTLEERRLAKRNPQGATINQLYPDGEGAIPPLEDNEILLERTTAAPLHLKKGDKITIELESGRKREMRVAGIVYDINSPPYVFTNWLSGYVNPDTMEWLEGSRDFNSVLLKVKENNTDEEHVKSVAALVADKIEKSGHEDYFTFVLKPGRHWGSDITQALLMVMSILGFLSVLLSGFLVLNTILPC